MTIPTRTYTYIANTLAQSNQANVNENTLYAWANGGIDDTNLNHLVGIYASSITGTTAAQCTFGTNPAASAGYKFVAPSSGLTPLTISGVTGQSVNILNVQSISGATSTFFDSNGVLNFAKTTFGAAGSSVWISGDSQATYGMFLNVPTASTKGWQFLVNGAATVASVGVGGSIWASVLTATIDGLSTKGFKYGVAASASTNAILFGNASGAGSAVTAIDCNGDTVQTIVGTVFEITNRGSANLLTVDSSGDLGIAGTLHQASARKYKTNIEYVDPAEALQIVLATKIARYDWKSEEPISGGGHASFIADDTPWQLSGGPGREHADPQKTASYVLAALQAVYAEVKALEGKLPAA